MDLLRCVIFLVDPHCWSLGSTGCHWLFRLLRGFKTGAPAFSLRVRFGPTLERQILQKQGLKEDFIECPSIRLYISLSLAKTLALTASNFTLRREVSSRREYAVREFKKLELVLPAVLFAPPLDLPGVTDLMIRCFVDLHHPDLSVLQEVLDCEWTSVYPVRTHYWRYLACLSLLHTMDAFDEALKRDAAQLGVTLPEDFAYAGGNPAARQH